MPRTAAPERSLRFCRIVLDTRDQLFGLIGLREEVVGAALETADDVHRLAER